MKAHLHVYSSQHETFDGGLDLNEHGGHQIPFSLQYMSKSILVIL